MVFNDIDNYDGMVQDAERWLFGGDYGAISNSTKLLKTFTALFNYGQNETASLLLEVDRNWQFDDTNNTDLPIGTTDLAAGQQDYSLNVDFIAIEGVEVLDNDGNYQKVSPIDYRDIRRKGLTQTEYEETDGMPNEYEVIGNTIMLYPAPAAGSVTTSAGLKVFFKRPPSYFEYTDTTKVPGIPTLFHDVPVLYGCAKYAKQNSMTEKARELDAELQRRNKQIEEHYSQRQLDVPHKLIPNVESNR